MDQDKLLIKEKEFENHVRQFKLEVQMDQEKLLTKEKEFENHAKQFKLEEAKEVKSEHADTVNFLDKKNKEFYKKLKKNRMDIKTRNQVEQNTRSLEWCNGCLLYLSKIHLCTTVGVWMNIDSFNQHLVIGRNEEDVKRTNNLEGSNYKVYNFTKRQEMHQKLKKMDEDEQRFKRLEREKPDRYNRLATSEYLHETDVWFDPEEEKKKKDITG